MLLTIDNKCEYVIKENMVLHIIPWIQIKDYGAIGISDTVVIGYDNT